MRHHFEDTEDLFLYIVGIFGPSTGSSATFDIAADCLLLPLKGQVTAGAAQPSRKLTLQTWLARLGLLDNCLHNQDIRNI